MKGFMYILKCTDGSYYTGSTNNLELRLQQHQAGEGANHTRKQLPVELVYFEEFNRIDEAFYREKQVQGWSRKKKEALISGAQNKLPELSIAYRDIKAASRASRTSAPAATIPTGTEALEVPITEALEGNDKKMASNACNPVASRTSATDAPEPEVLEGSFSALEIPGPEALEGSISTPKNLLQ
jgi:putative endonuclease